VVSIKIKEKYNEHRNFIDNHCCGYSARRWWLLLGEEMTVRIFPSLLKKGGGGVEKKMGCKIAADAPYR
jgi:hypothetical protein